MPQVKGKTSVNLFIGFGLTGWNSTWQGLNVAKTLKIWNGRGYCCIKDGASLFANRRPNGDIQGFVAAYSRADARRVIAEYTGRDPGETELRDYWHEGAWGNSMAGVTPERGLWVAIERDAPVRVL